MKIARRQMKVEVPSVAMGDIAFNLLIFFVILAKAQDDSHLKLSHATSAVVERSGETRVSVAIDRENKLYLNGREIGIAQLAPAIEAILGDAPAGKRMVHLKVHKEAQTMRFQPVIEAISEAGGEMLHVLEKKQ